MQTIPTIGFNVESIQHKKLQLTIWDLGGQVIQSVMVLLMHKHILITLNKKKKKKKDKIRPLWRHYYSDTQVIIFVIDSNDKQRIDDRNGCNNNAKKELHTMLSEPELQDIILLIYANKQDLDNVMNEMEITERLELDTINENIKWKVQTASALTGDGLTKGLEWIYKQLKKRNSKSNHKRKNIDKHKRSKNKK